MIATSPNPTSLPPANIIPDPPKRSWYNRAVTHLMNFSGPLALVAFSTFFIITSLGSPLALAISGTGATVGFISSNYRLQQLFKPTPPPEPPQPSKSIFWNHWTIKPLIGFVNTIALSAISGFFFYSNSSPLIVASLGGSGIIVGGFSSSYWLTQIVKKICQAIRHEDPPIRDPQEDSEFIGQFKTI